MINKPYQDNEIIIRPSKMLFTLISFSHALLIFLIHVLDLTWYIALVLVIITLLSFYYYSRTYFLRRSKKTVKKLEYQEDKKTWELSLGNDTKVIGRLRHNNFTSNVVLVLNFDIINPSYNQFSNIKKQKKQQVSAIVFNDSVSITTYRYLKRKIKYLK